MKMDLEDLACAIKIFDDMLNIRKWNEDEHDLYWRIRSEWLKESKKALAKACFRMSPSIEPVDRKY